MAINLFSDYGGFYNNYRVNEIPKVDVEKTDTEDLLKKQAETVVPELPLVQEAKPSEPEVTDNRTRTADLDNISLTFNKGDDFSYIGSDFEIESLDISKAISDMRKDKILEDYQYFVGTTNDGTSNPFESDDGKVFLKF